MDIGMKINKSSKACFNYSSQSALSASSVKFGIRKPLLKQKYAKNICKCLSVSSYNSTQLDKVWSELREKMQFFDGTIKSSDGAVFQIHRPLLATVSPYFKAVFTNTLNRGKPEIFEVHLTDISSDVLSLILDFIYTGRCGIDGTNVEKLLPAADQLCCDGIVKRCCEFLLEKISPENCLGIFIFAKNYFCRELQKESWNYIMGNWIHVLHDSTEFEELNYESVCEILSNDYLNAPTEKSVYEAVEKWIEKNPEERKQYIYNLFQCVRFALMSKEYYDGIVKANKYLNQETKELLHQFEKEYECGMSLEKPIMRPRIPYEIVFAIGGWSDGNPTTVIETYNSRVDQWYVCAHEDSTARAYHGIIWLNNLIYLIGGFDGDNYFNSVRCFDPVKKTWSDRACMYFNRCYASYCILNGEIYAMGGFDGRIRMDCVERYRPAKNQWQMIQPMNTPRSDASAATLNNKIYIVGGFNGVQILSSAEVYDPVTGQWTSIAPMMSPRTGVSLLEYKGCVYAVGGFDGMERLSSGEKYDPSRANCWQSIPSMLYERSNFTAVELEGFIFVIGGFDGTNTMCNTEFFDEEAKVWVETAPMNVKRSALSACICHGLANRYEYSYYAADTPTQQTIEDVTQIAAEPNDSTSNA